jgi:hypothetical protein
VLVILETLDTITSSSFNENHASNVRKLFNNLNEIQATHPCTFLVSHHFGKKENDSEPTSWIRGSSTLTAAVDVAYSIQNVRSPSDAKTFLVQPIPKRVKTASAFQFDLRGHEEDGMTAVAFLKWLRDWDVDLEPELIEKRVLILELVRDRGTEGVTVNDVTNAAEGYVGQKQVRQILDSLEKEGLVAMNSEAHNRFRFWIPECAPASVPEEATKEPSPSRERWEPL